MLLKFLCTYLAFVRITFSHIYETRGSMQVLWYRHHKSICDDESIMHYTHRKRIMPCYHIKC